MTRHDKHLPIHTQHTESIYVPCWLQDALFYFLSCSQVFKDEPSDGFGQPTTLRVILIKEIHSYQMIFHRRIVCFSRFSSSLVLRLVYCRSKLLSNTSRPTFACSITVIMCECCNYGGSRWKVPTSSTTGPFFGARPVI